MAAGACGAALLLASCGRGSPGPAEPAGYLGPEIVLVSPARGAVIQGTGPVHLAGRACDAAHGLTSLRIAGTDVAITAPAPGRCQPFGLDLPAAAGLNVVRGAAANDAGEQGTLVQAFLLAPDAFSLADGDPAARAPDGLVLSLGQQVFDDGDRTTPDDLATLAELGLAGLDLDAAVGPVRFAQPDADGDGSLDVVAHDCLFFTQRNKATGFEAWKTGPLERGPITVDRLQLVDGGLAARLTAWSLRLPMAVTGVLDSGCLGAIQDTVGGSVSVASVSVEATAALGLDASGRPRAEVGSVAVTMDGLSIDIDLGLLDFTGLGSAIGDAIAARIQGPVEDAIRAAVVTALGDELGRLLGALAGSRATLALPPQLGGVELVLDAPADRLGVAAGRAVLGSSLQVRPVSTAAGRAPALGAMRLGGGWPGEGTLAAAPAILGLADDALNQVLFAAWLGGAFDAPDLSSRVDLGLPGARMSVASLLPPAIAPRSGGGLVLGWGDVAFDVSLSGPQGSARIQGFLSASIPLDGVAVGPAGDSLAPAFGAGAEVHVQVTGVDWAPLPAARLSAEQILEGVMLSALPRLLAAAGAGQVLPGLDIHGVDPALPSRVLRLQGLRAVRSGSYQLVGGRVVANP